MAMDPATGLPANYTLPQTGQPSNYTLPQDADYRRKMAFELMYGKGQTQQPEMKHWTQLLGNIGNSYAGNKMFNQANVGQRGSIVGDQTKLEGGLWGQPKPPVVGVGGPPAFQASGPIPGQVGPTTPPSPGGGPSPMPGGMPALGTPPPGGTTGMTPGDIPGMPPGGQNLPNEGGIFGGLGWKPVGWPQG